jgi:hypothetical protein
MGDAGVATSPGPNSLYWNPSKAAFLEGKGGISLSYTPWIRALVPYVHLICGSGAYRLSERHALSSSFRVFRLGKYLNQVQPREYAFDIGYSYRFLDGFAGGIALRYIHSQISEGQEWPLGTTLAGDLGLYYQHPFGEADKGAMWAVGLNISNVGKGITYDADSERVPIPSNLRLGGRVTVPFSSDHRISLHLDLNKLLVPTPPVYEADTATGDVRIVRGMEPPRSLFMAMFRSFFDAPGFPKENGETSVFLEEVHEISVATGVEYRYRELLAVRAGYFHEHATKGNRKYVTIGAGTGYRFLALDVSYLIPVGSNDYLKDIFRISLKCMI